MYYIPQTFLIVRDDEGPITFYREDLLKYSGNRGLIASGVVFRLMGAAIEDLSPNEVPFREKFRFRTSFPGAEVVDGLELITRAKTENRFFLDTSIAPAIAPQTPANGAMYFEVAYGDKAMAYSFDGQIFTKEWSDLVLAHQEGSASEEEHAQYLEYKYDILGKLVCRPNVFNLREPISIERFK